MTIQPCLTSLETTLIETIEAILRIQERLPKDQERIKDITGLVHPTESNVMLYAERVLIDTVSRESL